jgi:hypothetical protein
MFSNLYKSDTNTVQHEVNFSCSLHPQTREKRLEVVWLELDVSRPFHVFPGTKQLGLKIRPIREWHITTHSKVYTAVLNCPVSFADSRPTLSADRRRTSLGGCFACN